VSYRILFVVFQIKAIAIVNKDMHDHLITIHKYFPLINIKILKF